MSDKLRIEDLIDRFGPDFANWPDSDEAGEARRAVLANPALRQTWDDARRLDALLGERERVARTQTVADGAPGRVASWVMARARPGARISARGKAIAAALVLFAFLVGASSGWLVSVNADERVAETYSVEGLVFGSLDGDVEWN